jgi:hypothetical protein
MPVRSVEVSLTNLTPYDLTLMNSGLNHGAWTPGWTPPPTIPGLQVGQQPSVGKWLSESDGIGTGTEGYVRYQIGPTDSSLYFHWDNPFFGYLQFNGNTTDEFSQNVDPSFVIDDLADYEYGYPGFFNWFHWGEEHAQGLFQIRYTGSDQTGLGNEVPAISTSHSGNFIQGDFGVRGNFEACIMLDGTLCHLWRDNDAFGLPWHGPISAASIQSRTAQVRSGYGVETVGLIQTNYQFPGDLLAIAQIGLDDGGIAESWPALFFRDNLGWHGPFVIVADGKKLVGFGGQPALIQGSFGLRGNFELLLLQGFEIVHFWRDNDAPGTPWHGPIPLPATPGPAAAVALLQSSLGQLEVVARVAPLERIGAGASDSYLVALHRDSAGWHGPEPLVADGRPIDRVAGVPSFIQSTFGIRGNFEMVVVQQGQLAHFWRDNDAPGLPWHGPTYLPAATGRGSPAGIPLSASVIQSNFGAEGSPGNLEVMAVMSSPDGLTGDWLVSYWRDSTGWHGPFLIVPDGRNLGGDIAL